MMLQVVIGVMVRMTLVGCEGNENFAEMCCMDEPYGDEYFPEMCEGNKYFSTCAGHEDFAEKRV